MTYSLFSQYSIDTRELIDGYRDVKSRRGLEVLIRHGQVKAPPSVLVELSRVYDDVYNWARHRENKLFIELSNQAFVHVTNLINKYSDPFQDPKNPGITYPGLIKSETAMDADPEVIALAMEYGWTVVAEEKGICGACKIEGVKRIPLEELLDTEVPEWKQ